MNDKIPLNKHINLVSIFIFLILTLVNAILFYTDLISLTIALIGLAATLFIAATLKISDQWEKAVVLRMGKFIGLKGPGWFLIIPIIDRVDKYIDQRVRVTDIRADSTLTKDTVPVNVDAVVYWTVWDAEKPPSKFRNMNTPFHSSPGQVCVTSSANTNWQISCKIEKRSPKHCNRPSTKRPVPGALPVRVSASKTSLYHPTLQTP